MDMIEHKKYMKVAVSLAKKAIKNGDIPIGAIVIDKNGNILGKGYNRKEKENNPIKHAEIIAISKACKKIDNWRLQDCIIYTTLEPCLMCLGAILQTRISWIVFGLASEKFGSVKTLDKLRTSKKFDHSIRYTYELTLDSKEMLQSFFGKLRSQNDII